jgi:hypothetical protein
MSVQGWNQAGHPALRQIFGNVSDLRFFISTLLIVSLPDPVDVKQLDAWGMQHGVSLNDLISRFGGSI